MNAGLYSGGNICPGFNLQACFLRFPPCVAEVGTGRANPKAREGAGTGNHPRSDGRPCKARPSWKETSFSWVFGELHLEKRNRLRFKRESE